MTDLDLSKITLVMNCKLFKFFLTRKQKDNIMYLH